MPRIPVGNKYTATVTGSAMKHVICSHCGCEFVCQLKRQAAGEATSWLWLNNNGASYNARASATDALNNKLQNEIDAVPCPNCGMYQENMVRKLKNDAWNEVVRVAFSFGVIGVILVLIGLCLFSTLPSWLQSTLLVAIVGFWVWAVLRMTIRAYNLKPNVNAHKRKGRAFSEKYPVLRISEAKQITAPPVSEISGSTVLNKKKPSITHRFSRLRRKRKGNSAKSASPANKVLQEREGQIFCPRCGNEGSSEDSFCRKCGGSLKQI